MADIKNKLLMFLSITLIILLITLSFLYKNIQIKLLNTENNLNSALSEIQIKNQSINELKTSIKNQNTEIEKLKIDSENKQIIYKDKIKYITQTIEKEREVVKYLSGSEDCNKTKEIINEIINR